jgi:hypothetical protein
MGVYGVHKTYRDKKVVGVFVCVFIAPLHVAKRHIPYPELILQATSLF